MDFDFTFDIVEKILLKRALNDKKYLNIVSNIFDNRWFDNRNIGTILYIAVQYYKKYQNVPNISTLQGLFKFYCQKHTEITENDLNKELIEMNAFNICIDDECANKNLEKYIKEKAFYFCVSDSVTDQGKNKGLENSIAKHLEEFEKLLKMSFQDDDLGLNYFSKEGMDRHWDYIKNPEAKLSTGWDGLDEITNGGFLKDGRMLSLFVGQAGLGKSLFLSNIAVNFLKQNKSVVVISLEMSENVYAQRFDANISEDNVNRLLSSADNSRNKIEKFYQKYPDANLIVKEYPPKSVRVIDIENYLEKLKENGHRIDVIIVDYLNLVLPNVKMDNMYQSVMATSEQLRGLSYKFNAPVISATQANRSGQNNSEIGLENISESAGQGFTADFIGMLYSTEEDRSHGIINMRIAKNRFGQPGKSIPFRLNASNLILTDMTYEDVDNENSSEADNITRNLSNISSDVEDL